MIRRVSICLYMVILLLGAIASPQSTFAKTYIQGTASTDLSESCENNRPKNNSDYEAVLANAKKNAIRTWLTTKSTAFTKLFLSVEHQLEENFDALLTNSYVKSKCQAKTFTVAFRAEINEPAIVPMMTAKIPSLGNSRPRMTAVFMSRRQGRVTTFDPKVAKISESSQLSRNQLSFEAIEGSLVDESYNLKRSSKTSGGSTERKRDEIDWEVFRADGLDAAVNETFASFGYRTIDASQVAAKFPGFDIAAMRNEFGAGDDLTDETKSAAFEAIAGQIPILVIATVDVMIADTDIVTGLVRVYASVKAFVYRDGGDFFEMVASVSPTQEQGYGVTETQAETEALIKAAKQASLEIVYQLNAQEGMQ